MTTTMPFVAGSALMPVRRAAMFMLAIVFALLAAGGYANDAMMPAASADVGCRFCDGVRLQDEVVLVSTRNLCGSCDPETLRTGLVVENYAVADESGHRCWQPSNLESFLAFDPSVTTVFYVHGNQMTNVDAKRQGLALYRRLVHYGCGAKRIRYVIFSWPSAKVAPLLRDVRIKAMRTAPAGCQLAWLLNQMPAETPVSLIGFSFGARIITGGLHVLGGGDLGCGLHLEPPSAPRAPVNVVLIAAAVHAHWLCDGQYHGLAMTQVHQMFLLNNCRDLALRYYHLSSTSGGKPQALGLCGPTCIGPQYAAKIQMRDVSRYAGPEHDLFEYLCAPGATGQVWEYAVGMAGTDDSELRLQAAN